jgi:predicted transcriptional regulator
MEIPFTQAQEAHLVAAAEYEGKAVIELVLDSVNQRLQQDQYFLDKLDRSIAQADRGEFIEEEEMDLRVAKMLAR